MPLVSPGFEPQPTMATRSGAPPFYNDVLVYSEPELAPPPPPPPASARPNAMAAANRVCAG
jgi:hypothetical protein